MGRSARRGGVQSRRRRRRLVQARTHTEYRVILVQPCTFGTSSERTGSRNRAGMEVVRSSLAFWPRTAIVAAGQSYR